MFRLAQVFGLTSGEWQEAEESRTPGMEPTTYSVRCAPASGRGSCLALI